MTNLKALNHNDVKWASRHLNGHTDRLFVHQFSQATFKSYTSLSLYGGIHRWPEDSPTKGPLMQKSFPCHYVIIAHWSCVWRCPDGLLAESTTIAWLSQDNIIMVLALGWHSDPRNIKPQPNQLHWSFTFPVLTHSLFRAAQLHDYWLTLEWIAATKGDHSVHLHTLVNWLRVDSWLTQDWLFP